MKRRHFIITVWAGLFATLLLQGCVNDTDSLDIPQTTLSEITFSMTLPDARTPSVGLATRGMTGDGEANKEDEVRWVDLLVFDATNSDDERFLEWVEVEMSAIRQDFTQNSAVIELTAKLSRRTDPSRIVIVANVGLDVIAGGFTTGQTTKLEVMEALLHATTGSAPSDWKWKADGSVDTGYTPIPMYGEVKVDHIKSQTNFGSAIELTRMLARIDIENQAADFTLEEVYLVNFNTAGYIAPAWDWSGQLLDPRPDAPSIPSESGKKTGKDNAIAYAINGETSYVGEIYTYESAAAADGSSSAADGNSSRKDATCLVLKGKIGEGESSFYRVDFTAQSGASAEYLPLRRNYKYVVNITQADGRGYTTMEEAIASYTVLSNLKTRLIAYNRNNIKNIVYNGQYMLGVGESEVVSDKIGTNPDYGRQPISFAVFTDNPSGWTATLPSDVNWITFESASGEANDEGSQMVFNISMIDPESEPKIAERTAKITVTAGRLKTEVTVIQKSLSGATVRVLDEEGNEVENLFFSAQAPIEAQTVYVVWDAENCQGELKKTTEKDEDGNWVDISDKLIVYETITPPLYRTHAENLAGRVQAITIKPEPLPSEVKSRWDWLTFNVFNENWEWLANTGFKIDQVELTFLHQNPRTTGYPLGQEYTLRLESSSPWEITKITLSNDGLIKDLKDLYVGNKGALSGHDTKSLTFKTANWAKGEKGVLRIYFQLTYATFTFNRTIEIQLNGDWLDYTSGAAAARFYLYPAPFVDENKNAIWMTYEQAENACKAIGDGWRLPNLSELFSGYAYMNSLGGYLYTDSENGWPYGGLWSSSTLGANYQTMDNSSGYSSVVAAGEYRLARCVYKERQPVGKVYPYLVEDTEGTVIVSRDENGGIDPAALFSAGEIPDRSVEMNKVAARLLISNTDNSGAVTWAAANTICSQKGDGWRLPTLREGYLIWGLGGFVPTENIIDNHGHDDMDWPGSFTKMTDSNWLLTESEKDKDGNDQAWLFQADKQAMIRQPLTVDSWIKTRCVKSLD